MSKVITFSRRFQKGHPRAGEPTFFVEKIWNAFNAESMGQTFYMDYEDEVKYELNSKVDFETLCLFFRSLRTRIGLTPKVHTIRPGKRFKAGEKFSPRVWSGTPYHSKQIIIAPDLEVKQVYDIEIHEDNEIFIDGTWAFTLGSKTFGDVIAQNDGLSVKDFQDWFSELPFKGQIICWTDHSIYSPFKIHASQTV